MQLPTAVYASPDSVPRSLPAWLPPDDLERTALHNEVHAPPPARLKLPALLL